MTLCSANKGQNIHNIFDIKNNFVIYIRLLNPYMFRFQWKRNVYFFFLWWPNRFTRTIQSQWYFINDDESWLALVYCLFWRNGIAAFAVQSMSAILLWKWIFFQNRNQWCDFSLLLVLLLYGIVEWNHRL